MVILALIILGGRYLLQPVLHRIAHLGSPEIFTASAVLLVLGTAVLMENIGLSMAMGAFVAGLLIADSEFRHQIVAEIQPFRGLLLGLFFMSMGMSLELKQFFVNPLVFIGLVLTLMATKVVILWLLAKMVGQQGGTAPAIALLLAQSGEFALVLFALAFESALIDEGLFQQLLVIVILSMLTTPPLAGFAYRLANSTRDDPAFEKYHKKGEPFAPIVIVGFGQVGRRIGEILEMQDVLYVAVDNNANVVQLERRAGRSVYYGDARQPDVLKSLGVGDAELVLVTVDDFQATEQVVSSLHRTFPHLAVLARGHDLEHCRNLRQKGAWLAVSENLEASIALAHTALEKVIGEDAENDAVIDRYRKAYYSDSKPEVLKEPKQ